MTSRRLRIRGSIAASAGDGRVALAAPDVVLGAVEVARRPGVADDEREVGRQRDRPPVERPAIEQDRRALDAARRRRTGPSARSGRRHSRSPRAGRVWASRNAVDGRGGVVEEGPGRGQLDRRRRREAGVGRQGRGDDAAQAGQRQARLGRAPRPCPRRSRATCRPSGAARRDRSRRARRRRAARARPAGRRSAGRRSGSRGRWRPGGRGRRCSRCARRSG